MMCAFVFLGICAWWCSIVYDHKLLDNRGLLSVQGGLRVLYLEIDIVSCEKKSIASHQYLERDNV